MALTQKDLNTLRCEGEGCTCTANDEDMYLHSSCHPDAAVDICYRSLDGNLYFTCQACKETIISIKVAE